jgi:hypothetical protein
MEMTWILSKMRWMKLIKDRCSADFTIFFTIKSIISLVALPLSIPETQKVSKMGSMEKNLF